MARATDFRELVSLVERAETALINGGEYSDFADRLSALRGVYYGTPWSRDFVAEGSQIRNLGFTVFTGFSRPPDPRAVLGDSLFADLQASQDVRDGLYRLDLGHALIGLEARNSTVARTVTIPTQGGTGLEIVTWLGDLGGGAANLAWNRARRGPERSVRTVFRAGGSDYGASINLEGDIAGYLLGARSTLAAPLTNSSTTIADLLRGYLPITQAGRGRYLRRSQDFLSMLGGRFQADGGVRLANRSQVIAFLRRRIQAFAGPYMLQRYVARKNHPPERIALACRHVAGAAAEVAWTLTIALEITARSPRRAIRARAPWQQPTPPAARCSEPVLQLASQAQGQTPALNRLLRNGRRAAEDWLRELID